MKFQRAAEFMRVPPDLTTTLCKYMVLRLLFPLHSWHCCVQTESNTMCVRGIDGKRYFEGNGRDTRWIVSDFVRAYERGLPKWKWPDFTWAWFKKSYELDMANQNYRSQALINCGWTLPGPFWGGGGGKVSGCFQITLTTKICVPAENHRIENSGQYVDQDTRYWLLWAEAQFPPCSFLLRV
jgi:hypothetical protein